MTINCVRCNKPFSSLVIDQEKAWEEVYMGLMRHVERAHPKTNKRVQQQVAMLATTLAVFVTANELAVVPESEDWIGDKLEESQDVIMKAMGFEPDEDEENEEGDDLEDSENEPMELPAEIEPIETEEMHSESDQMELTEPINGVKEDIPF